MTISNKEFLKERGVVITFPELLKEFGEKKYREDLVSLDYYVNALKRFIGSLKLCKEHAKSTLPNTIFNDALTDDIQKLFSAESEAEFNSAFSKLAFIINQNMTAIKYQ